MKKKIWGLFFCLGISTGLAAQNLLPNGDFEFVIADRNCNDPIKAFQQLEAWYPLDASPDLFNNNCPFDENNSVFWDNSLAAYEGKRFAGLSSRWNSNSTYVSEGIAVKLERPLEAGRPYFFEMAIRNRGGYQGFDEAISNCNLRPEKHIDLYTATDSIFIENNFANGSASINAQLVAILQSEAVQSRVEGGWTIVSACFTAKGGEQYFAIVMPLGTFGTLPACAGTVASGVFRSFYYHLDALQLTTTPSTLSIEVQKCEQQPLEINLNELIDTTLFKVLRFEWADGSMLSKRQLNQPGQYAIRAILECAAIPIELQLQDVRCTPDIYAPNIFSPNFDGFNDRFKIQLGTVGTITTYHLQIFDRWGNIIFQTTDEQAFWDGTANGQPLATGAYSWQLQFTIETLLGEQAVKKSGTVVLTQ